MPHTLFISDLHLMPERTLGHQLFEQFIHEIAIKASALYILGDFFETWIGDDHVTPFNQDIISKLNHLAKRNIPVYFLHGNRDFLIAEQFAKQSHCQLLADPFRLELYGVNTLLSHGDLLCTDDIKHQEFRSMVLNPAWQAEILQLPLAHRLQLATKYRLLSQSHLTEEQMAIMDINIDFTIALMRKNNVQQLIHGHTHRPKIHSIDDNKKRIVLGAWYKQGHYLKVQKNKTELISFNVLTQ